MPHLAPGAEPCPLEAAPLSPAPPPRALLPQLQASGETNCLLDNRWAAIRCARMEIGWGHARAAHTRERGAVCAGPARARDKTADSTATRHDPKGLLTNRPGPGKRLRTQVRGGDDLVAGRGRTAARSRPSARERGAQAAPRRQAGLRPAAAKDPKGCGGHVCRKAALQAEGRAGGQAF